MNAIATGCPVCGRQPPGNESICPTCTWAKFSHLALGSGAAGTGARYRRPIASDPNSAPKAPATGKAVDLAGAPPEPEPWAAPVALPAEAAARQQPRIEIIDQNPRLVLELVSEPGRRFILRDGQTIGRRDAGYRVSADVVVEDVPDVGKLSRRHACFVRREGRWYVQHVGSVNFIVVDGVRYDKDDLVPLEEGSRLVLSTTPFRVSFLET